LAKKVANILNIENQYVAAIDKISIEDITPNDHLILMYSIHGFNPPRTVKRFVKNLPGDLFQEVSLIAVGCNTSWVNDANSIGLKKYFKKQNYIVVVDEILAMPLTIVMNFPEETTKKMIEEANNSLHTICKNIQEKTTTDKKTKITSKLIHLFGKLEDPAARLFGLELHAKKNCTSCGICWNNCPEFNITQNKKDKPSFGFSCSMCMRCIYDCPVQAITPRISKFLPIKNGYTLKE